MFLSKGANVLSLFDGKSSGRTACDLAGIGVNKYYSCEIDKYANIVSNAMYPHIIRLGDILNWREWDIDWASIDLILAGSPCQGFSFAGKQLAFDDPRSALFFVFVDILNHIKSFNPDVEFMLENVKMKTEYVNIISDKVEAETIIINSNLVSAQNRQRNYWCNWGVPQPDDREIYWPDIMLNNATDCMYYSLGAFNWLFKDDKRAAKYFQYSINTKVKMQMIEASHHKGYSNQRCFGINDNGLTRYIHPVECFRAQTVPEHLIDKILTCGVSNTQLYKIAGNGWTDEVIAHNIRHSKLGKQHNDCI